MADIDVVKKESRTWLWVLLVLAALLILWFLMSRGDAGTQQIGQLFEGRQPHHAAASVRPV